MASFLALMLAAGCAGDAQAIEAASGEYVFAGGHVYGVGQVDLRVVDGVITEVGPSLLGGERVDVTGQHLVPAAIDAHVHLSYWDAASDLRRNGVVGVVDLAAPLRDVGATEPVAVRASGPMITAESGYPTRSWGSDGYGLPCSGPDACAAAVDTVLAEGAVLIKVPITTEPTLTDAELAAIVTRAHAREVLVVAHALDDVSAARAAAAGVDVLAHTPVGAMSDATVEAWRGRAVISTLMAFGDRFETRSNLRRLHTAGVTVVYGTDLGNRRVSGLDAAELAALLEVGLSPAEVVASVTSTPAALFGFDGLGALAVGSPASFFVLDEDPLDDPLALAQPDSVWVQGVAQRR